MKRPSFGIIAPEKRIMAIDEIRRGDEQEEDGTDEVIRQDPFVVLLGLQEAHAEVIEESGNIDHSDVKQFLPETSFLLLGRGVGHECRSEEHTSELQSLTNIVCSLLLEKKIFPY